MMVTVFIRMSAVMIVAVRVLVEWMLLVLMGGDGGGAGERQPLS